MSFNITKIGWTVRKNGKRLIARLRKLLLFGKLILRYKNQTNILRIMKTILAKSKQNKISDIFSNNMEKPIVGNIFFELNLSIFIYTNAVKSTVLAVVKR